MARKSDSTLGIKILALFIALLIWVYVFYQEGRAGDKTFFSIPIVPQSVPKDMVLMNTNNLPTATIKLFGSERSLETIDRDNISAYIDLLNSSPGSKQVKVECRFPNEKVSLSSINPKTVSVELQPEETIELDIKYEFIGEPPTGITMEEPTFEPATFKVTGPYSTISTLSYAFVSIDQTTAKVGSNSYSLPIVLENNTGNKILQSSWGSLHFKSKHETIYTVVFASSNKKSYTIPTELKTTGSIGPKYIITSINWDPKLISIEGEASTLENIEGINSEPLNLNAITKSTSYKLSLIAPKGVKFSDEKTINVSVSVKPIMDRLFTNIKVNVSPDNVMYSLYTKTVNVRIRGPKDTVENINSISASIDISGLSSGDHELPVTIEGLPDYAYPISTPTARIHLQ